MMILNMKTLMLALLISGFALFGFQGDKGPTSFTPDSLGAALKTIGYEATQNKNGTWTFTVKDQGNTIPITACVSKDGSNVWLSADFGKLSTSDLANADWLLSVLKANLAAQPASYYIQDFTDNNQTSSYLYFDYPHQNKTSDPDVLKKEITDYATEVSGDINIWEYPSLKKGK